MCTWWSSRLGFPHLLNLLSIFFVSPFYKKSLWLFREFWSYLSPLEQKQIFLNCVKYRFSLEWNGSLLANGLFWRLNYWLRVVLFFKDWSLRKLSCLVSCERNWFRQDNRFRLLHSHRFSYFQNVLNRPTFFTSEWMWIFSQHLPCLRIRLNVTDTWNVLIKERYDSFEHRPDGPGWIPLFWVVLCYC